MFYRLPADHSAVICWQICLNRVNSAPDTYILRLTICESLWLLHFRESLITSSVLSGTAHMQKGKGTGLLRSLQYSPAPTVAFKALKCTGKVVVPLCVLPKGQHLITQRIRSSALGLVYTRCKMHEEALHS